MTAVALAKLSELVGAHLGHSSWREITQEDVDDFARVTRDEQWIHVDPEKAKSGPFGTTVAHGFMTLSLLSTLLTEVLKVSGVALAINYGLNRVRFPAPLPVGSRVRLGAELVSAEEVQPGTWQATVRATIERDGGDKPVCVAESVLRFVEAPA